PTRSPGFYVQMLGRGMRKAPGKRDCLVIDVMGNHPELTHQMVLPQIVGVSTQEETHVLTGRQTQHQNRRILCSRPSWEPGCKLDSPFSTPLGNRPTAGMPTVVATLQWSAAMLSPLWNQIVWAVASIVPGCISWHKEKSQPISGSNAAICPCGSRWH